VTDGGVAGVRRPRPSAPAGVAAVLVAANVVNNRVLPDRDLPYVGSCLGAAAALVALARADGCTWDELGLGPAAVASGARTGAVAAGVVAAGLAVARILPAGRAALRDERVTGRSRAAVLRAALVRVPLGTVVLEEVAFRGVLPAVLRPRLGRGTATVGAVAFGAWHVLPSTGLAGTSEVVSRVSGGSSWRAVALAVTSTTVAGLGFTWLRDRSGSVVAPALAHWSSNGLGYLLAATVGARRR
jgi:uncharacterized protein